DTTQPVLVMSSGVFSQMRLTSNRAADAGQQAARVINIQDGAHPIASGLSGQVTVSDQNVQLNFGAPGPDAKVIATLNNDASRARNFLPEATGASSSVAS